VGASNVAPTLYADPTSIVANCYDPVVNPGAPSWFRASATVLIEFAVEYLVLLDRYDVAWSSADGLAGTDQLRGRCSDRRRSSDVSRLAVLDPAA
jgi:hypothetical protein